jgi:hypothetical protein
VNRLELSGYAQIVVGVVGILVTVFSAPSLLETFDTIGSGHSMPPELKTLTEGAKLFGLLLILLSLVFLMLLGIATTVSVALSKIGLPHPLLLSTVATGALFTLAVALTLALLGNPYWVAAFIAGFGMAVSAWVGVRTKFEEADFSITAGLFLLLFLGTGLVTLMAEHPAPQNPAPAQGSSKR